MLWKKSLNEPPDFESHRGNELQSEDTLTGDARLPGTRVPPSSRKRFRGALRSSTCKLLPFTDPAKLWASLLVSASFLAPSPPPPTKLLLLEVGQELVDDWCSLRDLLTRPGSTRVQDSAEGKISLGHIWRGVMHQVVERRRVLER